MAQGSGIRPWKRGSEAARRASTTVIPNGDLVVTDEGALFPGDGTTQARRLRGLRPLHVDLRDHIVSVTPRTDRDPLYVFDAAAVIASAEARNGSIFVPPGDWQANAWDVVANSGITDTLQGPRQRFGYRFFGAGAISRILLPSTTSTSTLFVVNSTNSADFHSHPKVVVENLSISGVDIAGQTAAATGGFITCNQRSLLVRNVYVSSCKDPFRVTGYSDFLELDTVLAIYTAAGSYILNASTATGGTAGDSTASCPSAPAASTPA